MAQGGSGFSPPYLCPRSATANQLTPFPTIATTTSTTTTTTTTNSTPSGLVNITIREGGKPIPAAGATANRFVRGLGDPTRHDPPASVFCSRELENALADFVTGAVLAGGGGAAAFPSDEALRERARQFLGGAVLKTPADDKVLLGRFGEVMRRRLGLLPLGGQGGQGGQGLGGEQQQQQHQQQQQGLGLDGGLGLGFGMGAATASTGGMDFSAPSEMNAMDADVMQQMDFDFSDLGDFMGVATGGMPMDQL